MDSMLRKARRGKAVYGETGKATAARVLVDEHNNIIIAADTLDGSQPEALFRICGNPPEIHFRNGGKWYRIGVGGTGTATYVTHEEVV